MMSKKPGVGAGRRVKKLNVKSTFIGDFIQTNLDLNDDDPASPASTNSYESLKRSIPDSFDSY